MALPQTYARRKRRRAEEGKAKVFRSKPLGKKLLTQLSHAFEAIDAQFSYDEKMIDELTVVLREEIGVLSLANQRELTKDFYGWWFSEQYIPPEDEHDMRLSAIELACQIGLRKADLADRRSVAGRKLLVVRNVVAVINERMMEDGFGFQFQNDQLIEITSEFTFKEMVEPALALLANPIFAAADGEFRDAIDEFKQRNYDDCIADCGNAFESTIKVIAAQKGWNDVKPTDNASKLIDALYRHDLIPPWMQEQMTGLRQMLQGAPTVRNKEASHGAGEAPRKVSKALAAYQMHQTAAAILFLISQAGLA